MFLWIIVRRFGQLLALLGAAFVGGLLTIPAMSIGRQAIAALVPPDQRRTAYSMDSMDSMDSIVVEMCFMIGPVVGVALATQVSTSAALRVIAAGILVVGVALFLVNPPVRARKKRCPGRGRRGGNG